MDFTSVVYHFPYYNVLDVYQDTCIWWDYVKLGNFVCPSVPTLINSNASSGLIAQFPYPATRGSLMFCRLYLWVKIPRSMYISLGHIHKWVGDAYKITDHLLLKADLDIYVPKAFVCNSQRVLHHVQLAMPYEYLHVQNYVFFWVKKHYTSWQGMQSYTKLEGTTTEY